MAVAVAATYIRFERLPWIQDVFYGVGAAVIAIIAQSAYRLSRKRIPPKPGKPLVAIADGAVILAATVAIFVYGMMAG